MSVIEFPGRGDPPEDGSDDEIHAEAFRESSDRDAPKPAK
jgi:hypothetical protein